MSKCVYSAVFLFLFSTLVEALADDFSGQLSRAGVTKPDIEILVNSGYTDIAALQPLNLGALLRLGVSGRSASIIKGLTDVNKTSLEPSPESYGKLSDVDLPAGWKIVEKSIQSIQTMQKDVYEKTSEFQARRQTEIDKLVGQIKTGSEEGDVSYQVGTATIRNYDADTENVRFSIAWIEPLKQFIKGKGVELTESTTSMSPTEARSFPIGESFPLFANVRWSSDNLLVENVWLDRADLRELKAQAEREKQQKLQKEKEAQEEQERIKQEIARNQSLAQEQARQNELLIQKQHADVELAKLARERQEIEEAAAKQRREIAKARKAQQSENPIEAIRNYYDAINRGDVDYVIDSWLSPNKKKLESYIGGKRHRCLINEVNMESSSSGVVNVLTDVTCDGKRWKVIISQKKIGERWKILEIKNPS